MKQSLRLLLLLSFIAALFFISCTGPEQGNSMVDHESVQTGSVIFIHPDGSGLNMWNALRLIKAGPDSMIYWDRLSNLGLYRSHVEDCITTSSHAGATVHSYGIKVPYDTYGSNPRRPITSLSGKSYSIMTEAIRAGFPVALINSGHVCEPGTGVFVANAINRNNTDTISEQIIRSGVDIILSGGEIYLLPEGAMGVHGDPGIRKDGNNLIELAIELGYHVVYNRDQLLALPLNTSKVLGIFASKHTFHDMTEEELSRQNLPLYSPNAPTLSEMTSFALKLLEYRNLPFLMVVEEEGSDNFANDNNAIGALTALSRADDAIGVAINYIMRHPNTMLITAADSDAGGMQVETFGNDLVAGQELPSFNRNGAPLDGIHGSGSLPFTAKPDRNGKSLQFGITWASDEDLYGSVIVRTHGLNAGRLPVNVDNADIYRMMYLTLFGVSFFGNP